MSHPIGIDLGTTNSVVAYVQGGRAETIPNSEGQPTTPSVVLLREEDLLVGEQAKRQHVLQPQNTVRSVKRLMGRRYSEVKSRLGDFHFEIVEGPDDQPLIRLGELTVTPEEVSAAILTQMRMTAEEFLNEDIDQAVITVPAHFNDSQRKATKKAAELAGLEVLRIVNEPTAAALAYGIDKQKDEIVAVFDFGGGTFDISFLQISKGIFEVLSTNGDTLLGGDNLDQILTHWMLDAIREETGCDAEAEPQALQRVRETAEKVKCELSSLTSTTISLPFIVADASGPKHFTRELTREMFVEMGREVFERLVPPCRQALADAGIAKDRLARVLLVGGSTRIPEVRQVVREVFGMDPAHDIDPDEAVALGAAIQSAIVSGSLEEVLLLDVVPLSLGIELAGGLFKPLIARNSSIPTTASRRFTTVVDNQTSVMVHVLQGERKMAKENRTLARLRLTGVTPAPREVPEVEVQFHIDANGILQVSAQDITSGVANSINVESYATTAPNKDQVERLLSEAAQHAAEDAKYAANSHHVERMQKLQLQMERFLQVVDGVTEQDVKTVKEHMIHLDIAARAFEWNEIDRVELQFKIIKGKYGAEDQVNALLARVGIADPYAFPASAPKAHKAPKAPGAAARVSPPPEDPSKPPTPSASPPSASPVAPPPSPDEVVALDATLDGDDESFEVISPDETPAEEPAPEVYRPEPVLPGKTTPLVGMPPPSTPDGGLKVVSISSDTSRSDRETKAPRHGDDAKKDTAPDAKKDTAPDAKKTGGETADSEASSDAKPSAPKKFTPPAWLFPGKGATQPGKTRPKNPDDSKP